MKNIIIVIAFILVSCQNKPNVNKTSETNKKITRSLERTLLRALIEMDRIHGERRWYCDGQQKCMKLVHQLVAQPVPPEAVRDCSNL